MNESEFKTALEELGGTENYPGFYSAVFNSATIIVVATKYGTYVVMSMDPNYDEDLQISNESSLDDVMEILYDYAGRDEDGYSYDE